MTEETTVTVDEESEPFAETLMELVPTHVWESIEVIEKEGGIIGDRELIKQYRIRFGEMSTQYDAQTIGSRTGNHLLHNGIAITGVNPPRDDHLGASDTFSLTMTWFDLPSGAPDIDDKIIDTAKDVAYVQSDRRAIEVVENPRGKPW
jgi:hypothetical protein